MLRVHRIGFTRFLPILFVFLRLAPVIAHPRAKVPTRPDDRYKADLLLIVAHPDDESGDIAGYLARVIYDQHRRVAVVFVNRGQDGGNAAGREEGNAVGDATDIGGRGALDF